MGIIIAKFSKKKKTDEVLEELDVQIKSIETYRRNTEQSHKKIVGRFLLTSVAIYLGTAFLFYFYYFPATFSDRLYSIIPLICVPVIIISMKKSLTWYFNRKIKRNQQKLRTLHEERKKLLEKVMETETYKVAKTLLEKYAPEQVRRNSPPVPSDAKLPKQNNLTTCPTPQELRHRVALPAAQATRTFGVVQTPIRPIASSTMPQTAVASRSFVPVGATPVKQSVGIPGTPLPMPRAILPRERTILDKMVEYLVGDGPANRYALICKQCSSHNGMALKEEYEYLSFRCCYCYTFNPARKKRPVAPKLELTIPLAIQNTSESESEINSPSETDSDGDSDKKQKSTEVSSDQEKNGYDKLSDFDVRTFDTESTPMEVDYVPEKLQDLKQQIDKKIDNTDTSDDKNEAKTETQEFVILKKTE